MCGSPFDLGVERNQAMLDSVRESLPLLSAAVVSSVRAGMQPVVFDTVQLAIEVSVHNRVRAVGDVVSSMSGAGVSASAGYDVVFESPAVLPVGPSRSAGVTEIRTSMVVYTRTTPLAGQAEFERLASLPTSLEIVPVEVTMAKFGSTRAFSVDTDLELPGIVAAQLTRAPAIKPTGGFSPTLYVWRGADWAPADGGFGGDAFIDGNAAWGTSLDTLPLGQGRTAQHGHVWYLAQGSPPSPDTASSPHNPRAHRGSHTHSSTDSQAAHPRGANMALLGCSSRCGVASPAAYRSGANLPPPPRQGPTPGSAPERRRRRGRSGASSQGWLPGGHPHRVAHWVRDGRRCNSGEGGAVGCRAGGCRSSAPGNVPPRGGQRFRGWDGHRVI